MGREYAFCRVWSGFWGYFSTEKSGSSKPQQLYRRPEVPSWDSGEGYMDGNGDLRAKKREGWEGEA